MCLWCSNRFAEKNPGSSVLGFEKVCFGIFCNNADFFINILADYLEFRPTFRGFEMLWYSTKYCIINPNMYKVRIWGFWGREAQKEKWQILLMNRVITISLASPKAPHVHFIRITISYHNFDLWQNYYVCP